MTMIEKILLPVNFSPARAAMVGYENTFRRRWWTL